MTNTSIGRNDNCYWPLKTKISDQYWLADAYKTATLSPSNNTNAQHPFLSYGTFLKYEKSNC